MQYKWIDLIYYFNSKLIIYNKINIKGGAFGERGHTNALQLAASLVG